MKDFCLLINTCKHYYSNIDNIIKKLIKYNFPTKNILIVSAQEDKEMVLYEKNIKIIKVTYTGLHLTSAIWVNENINDLKHINYWMLLPDTIDFGDNFVNYIREYYNNHLMNKTVNIVGVIHPMVRWASMDMCILHTNQIINFTDYFIKIKSYNIDRDSIIKLKKQLIFDENTIVGRIPMVPHMATKHNCNPVSHNTIKYIINDPTLKTETFIENGTINQIYLGLIDIYKFQRNFKGPQYKLIMDLNPPYFQTEQELQQHLADSAMKKLIEEEEMEIDKSKNKQKNKPKK